MAINIWPFGKKQETNGFKTLNESQVKFLNTVFPGFETMQSNPEQLLEKLSVVGLTSPERYKELMGQTKNQVDSEKWQVAAAFATIYARISDSRRQILSEVDRMRNFYLVDVILTQLSEDALSPEIGTGHIINLTSEIPEIQREMEYLDERFEFDQLIQNITPDLICSGEYTLGTRVIPSEVAKQKLNKSQDKSCESLNENSCDLGDTGMVELRDNVDQTSIVALTKDCSIDGYLVRDSQGKVQYCEPADFIKFTLGGQRVRIDLHKEIGTTTLYKNKLQDLPRFIRVGKSIIHPILGKLRELELLETMVPATKLSKLASGTLIGVQVPPGYDIEKAMEASRRVEGLINSKVGVDNARGELSLENIISSAGKLKVVPIFGDKGTLSKLDYKSDEPDELLNSVNDIRKVILGSVGIPAELVFGLDGGTKGEILKKYARYLRKLKAIQKAIADGIRQIIYIHLANKGIDFLPDDIHVSFYNKLVEIDNLDKLEFMDTVIGMLDHMREFVNKMQSSDNPELAKYINTKDFVRFLDSQLDVVGLTGLINTDPKTGEPIPYQISKEQQINQVVDKVVANTKRLVPTESPDSNSETEVIDIEDLK